MWIARAKDRSIRSHATFSLKMTLFLVNIFFFLRTVSVKGQKQRRVLLIIVSFKTSLRYNLMCCIKSQRSLIRQILSHCFSTIAPRLPPVSMEDAPLSRFDFFSFRNAQHLSSLATGRTENITLRHSDDSLWVYSVMAALSVS